MLKQHMAKQIGIIFDMNGVIIDDIPFHKMAWIEFARRRGRKLSPQEFAQNLSGRTNAETFRYLFDRDFSIEEIRSMEEEKEEAYRALYRAHRALLPGLENFLVELAQAKIPLAVATAAPPKNVIFILDDLNIRKFFTTVVDASQVARGKPDPEIFLLSAARLMLDPTSCIVFEDALLGLQAARAAGMRTIGVTTTHAASELTDAEAIIADFKTMSLDWLTKFLNSSS